jgi:hypothetical protein
MKKIIKSIGGLFKSKDAGFLEYVFAISCIICVLPSVLAYIILQKLILQPAYSLVKTIWK